MNIQVYFRHSLKYAERIWTLARLTGGSLLLIMFWHMIESGIYFNPVSLRIVI